MKIHNIGIQEQQPRELRTYFKTTQKVKGGGYFYLYMYSIEVNKKVYIKFKKYCVVLFYEIKMLNQLFFVLF